MSIRLFRKKTEFIEKTGIQVDMHHKAAVLRKELISLYETNIYPQLGGELRALLSGSISNEFFCSRAASILDRCQPDPQKRESLKLQFVDNSECLIGYHRWIKKASIDLDKEAAAKLSRRDYDIAMDACRAVQNWCAGRSKQALEKENSPYFNCKVELSPWHFEEILRDYGLSLGTKSPWVTFCEKFDVPAFGEGPQFLKAA